ncbi:MAG: phosphoribosyltransferase [Xenococcaceae cyanobacterium]
MPDLYVSWSDYHQNIETLAVKIYQSGWDFNQIVCIAKGGLRVGDILCRLYRQPLAILSAASYGGADNRIREEITFSKNLSMTNDNLGSRVVLVDDLVDSGITLREGVRWLDEHYGTEIEQIRTAVIWYKSCSVIPPDYYVDYLPDDPWIHQPFAMYEQVTPAQLAARYQQLTLSD